jgi:hypothetical protein
MRILALDLGKFKTVAPNDLFGNRRRHYLFELDLNHRSKLSARDENGCLRDAERVEAASSSMKPTLVSTSYSPRVWSSIK